MVAGFDLYAALLALGVIALFGLFFWLVAVRIVGDLRRLVAWRDGAAARQRAAIEREAVEGPTPLWLKAIRFLLIAALVAILGYKFWLMTAG
ncbi:MAG: hypothetical protein AB7L41_08935 [Flavobacteriaceae bacterium]